MFLYKNRKFINTLFITFGLMVLSLTMRASELYPTLKIKNNTDKYIIQIRNLTIFKDSKEQHDYESNELYPGGNDQDLWWSNAWLDWTNSREPGEQWWANGKLYIWEKGTDKNNINNVKSKEFSLKDKGFTIDGVPVTIEKIGDTYESWKLKDGLTTPYQYHDFLMTVGPKK